MVEKRTYVQRDFSMGVVVPELIEGDDLEMRSQSLRDGKNLRITRGRTLRQRPGLQRFFPASPDQSFHDMRVHNGPAVERYAVIVEPNGLRVLDVNFELVATFTGAPWGVFPNGRPWVAQFENALVFGGYEFYALSYDAGTWSFGALLIEDLAGGEKALPYWAFERGITLTPSGYTGSITVTASSPIFNAKWVGKRIRYARKEMVVTALLSVTQLQCAVTVELPPTFRLTFASVAAVSGYAVGQVVTASETNWSGIITEIDGADILAVTLLRDASLPGGEASASGGGTGGVTGGDAGGTSAYGGPLTTDEILGPNAAAKPTVVAKEVAPQGTVIWDEQLWSDHRGWPRSGTEVNQRLALCDFPAVPNLICISSARRFNDFGMGSRDDDAILRQAGNNNPRFRHIINATDLILLADRGCYYVKTRDGEVLSPTNFTALQFDERGADDVNPVVVEGGVLFSERNKSALSACVLSGNVYLNWKVADLSRFHAHLFTNPVAICGPTADGSMSERYVIVANADGTMAAMSWYTTFGEEQVGFFPWETVGSVRSVLPLFDRYFAVVERTYTDGSPVSVYTLEAFNPDLLLDGAVVTAGPVNGQVLQTEGGDEITTEGGDTIFLASPIGFHLRGQSVRVWESYESAPLTLNTAGEAATEPAIESLAQIGLPMDVRAEPWPREVMESPRLGMIKARVIRASVGVRETIAFAFRRNNTTTATKARRPEDSPALPPPLKTDVYRFNIFGNRAHPEMEVFLEEPNPLEITSITQEVQG